MSNTILSPLRMTDSFWVEWDDLNTRHCANHPLLQSRMIKCMLQYFPAPISALKASEGNETIALLLIRSDSMYSGLVRKGYLPAQSQIALAQITPDCDRLKSLLFSSLPFSTQRIDLTFVDSHYQKAIHQAEGAQVTHRGDDMEISLRGDFSSYWSSRPKTLRKNMSRYTNRVNRELGKLSFQVVSDAFEIAGAVDRYGRLESKGWKGENGTALHPENRQGRFYQEVMRAYANTGEARVFELYHEDQLLASRLTIQSEQALIILKTTFNEDYRRFAVGRLLLHALIQHLNSEGELDSIGFYTNATADQLEWATDSKPVYNVSFYRCNLLAKVRRMLPRRMV